MFRTTRSVLLAVATAVTGLIAVPAGSVAADPVYPIAVISTTSAGTSAESATCQRGSDMTLWGDSSVNPAGTGLLYFWYLEDGQREGYEPSYEFPCDFAGTIEITMRATAVGNPDDYWEHDTATILVTSNEPPVARITVDGADPGDSVAVSVGSSVTFSAVTSSDPEGKPLQYTWSDGNAVVNGEATTQTCDSTRSFNLELQATDSAGISGRDRVTVNCVDTPPTGSFAPAPAPGGARTMVAVGTTITFKPTAPSSASAWEWRTTGVPGVASADYQFTRRFDTIGNYGVQLTETNAGGSASQWAGYTVIAPPIAAVTPAPAGATDRMTVAAGSTITFDGSGSRSPGGGSLTYQWRTTGGRGVVADTGSYTRRFDTVGRFGVELTVVNELGQTAKRWVGVNVVAAADPVVSLTNASADPSVRTPVNVGSTITFDARASVDPDGGPLTYQWRTTGSPGVVARSSTYVHTFDRAGNIGVELTVTDDEGRSTKRWVGFTVQP